MFRIHDILAWIRIRGSILTNGSGFGSASGFVSGSWYFFIDLQDANKKLITKSFSAYYFLRVHLRSFFKDKNSKRSHKTVGIRVTFLLDDRRMIEGSGSRSISLTNWSGSGRPKNMWIRWIRNTGKKTVFFVWMDNNLGILKVPWSEKWSGQHYNNILWRYQLPLERYSFYQLWSATRKRFSVTVCTVPLHECRLLTLRFWFKRGTAEKAQHDLGLSWGSVHDSCFQNF